MEYVFILSGAADVNDIARRLDRCVPNAWSWVGDNIRVVAPHGLERRVEEELLSAISTGGETLDAGLRNETKRLASTTFGALQRTLLDRFLPEAIGLMKPFHGIIVELDAIDDVLVLMRISGPEGSDVCIDEVSQWLMERCAVGVADPMASQDDVAGSA